jgi:hypothetical protein
MINSFKLAEGALLMKTKPIMAAAGAIACIILAWSPIAAGVPNAPGTAVNHDDQIATAGKHFILQAAAEDDDIETIEIDAGATAEDDTDETPENGTGQTAADDAVETTGIDAGAMAEDEANTQTGETSDTNAMEPQMATPKPVVTVQNRNTRLRTDPRADARACLDAGDNLAIIKCAEKYR